jgi:hypothetical protein
MRRGSGSTGRRADEAKHRFRKARDAKVRSIPSDNPDRAWIDAELALLML